MATIITGLRHSSRAGVHTEDNDTARFLHDQDGNVVHTANDQHLACFAACHIRGFSVSVLVSLTGQPQDSLQQATIVEREGIICHAIQLLPIHRIIIVS